MQSYWTIGHHGGIKAYSEDLRKRIVETVGRGMIKSEAARTFGASLSSVKRYVSMAHQGRSLTPKKASRLTPEDRRASQEAPSNGPPRATGRATLPQQREFLKRIAGARVSDSTVSRMRKRMKPKKRLVGASERDEWLRAAWRVMVTDEIDARRLERL